MSIIVKNMKQMDRQTERRTGP